LKSRWVQVTTETQFFYHLERGEFVAFRVENSEAFVNRLSNGTYRVIINHPFMPAVEYIAETEDYPPESLLHFREKHKWPISFHRVWLR